MFPRVAIIGKLKFLGLLVVWALGAACIAGAQAPPPEGRPIIFVHGWCSSGADWSSVANTIITNVRQDHATLYTDPTLWTLYYDGQNVKLWPTGNSLDTVPAAARFFSVEFSDPRSLSDPFSFDKTSVSEVSVLNKADELANVIRAITSLTLIKDVIVVGHSMGGLDARAYLENQGSTNLNACNDLNDYSSCLQGTTTYTGDIFKLITLDTPHSGAINANLLTGLDYLNIYGIKLLSVFDQCFLTNTLNRRELQEGSHVVTSLQSNVDLLPAEVTVTSIKSFTDPGLFSSEDDGVVSVSEQSFNNYDIENSFSFWTAIDCASRINVLHQLPCLGMQTSTITHLEDALQDALSPALPTSVVVEATLDGEDNSWAGAVNYQVNGPSSYGFDASAVPANTYSVPLGAYSVQYLGGGPSSNVQIAPARQVLGVDTKTGKNNWLLKFKLNFTSNPPPVPIIATLGASELASDGATMNGTVNAEGAATTAWFEWSTDSTLASAQSTPAEFEGSGTSPVLIEFAQSGLEANTTYYYELFASTGNGNLPGGIKQFQTQSTLPEPNLYMPANQAANVLSPPAFTWSAVDGAKSYRLIVATNPAALPTDPTNPNCGVGCVLNTTPIGPAYVPPLILAPLTTYYWEVHARSQEQDGNWSPIYSFTTAPPTVTNLTISPATVVTGETGNVTVTLSGNAPAGGIQVGLTGTNSGAFPIPPTIPIAAGSNSGTVTVQAGTVSGPTVVTATASYNGSIANTTVTVNPIGNSGVVLTSLSVSPSTIVGGLSPIGIITLSGSAPAGGATVNLSSNNTQLVQVPETATVQPGYTSVVFPVTTFFTSNSVGATITASYNNTVYGASLTVLPVAVSGVTFYPSSLTGGSASAFIVYLTGPAPAGAVVSFNNSNSAVLQIPSSAALPTGATSITVAGTTSNVGSPTNVTVTATYNGSSGQGTLTVVPAPALLVESLAVVPSEVTGGTTANGTVYLTGIAPAGGTSVTLSSSSGLVQVPSMVLVAAGTWYAPFSAQTSAVNSVTNLTLTASYAGSSQTATLTLVPPVPFLSSLSISPSTVNAGSTATGTVTLTSPAPLGGAGITLSTSFYEVASLPNSINVPAGATSATFNITTLPISFIQPITIGATYNGTSQNAMMIVAPAGTLLAPASLILNPQAVSGGAISNATVLLTGPAPSGGATLSVSSDNATAQVPPVINVPAGASSTLIAVNTLTVGTISTATITVSLNGISQSSLLTIQPVGQPPPGKAIPFLASPLVPISTLPGGSDLTLTINGSGFVAGAQVFWNSTALSTTFEQEGQLQATVPSVFLQANHTNGITVTNPGPASGVSNPLPEHLTFPITTPLFDGYSLSASGAPALVAAGDFNRDEKLDLAIGKTDGSGVSIFLGNGDGSFGSELLLPAIGPGSVTVVDLNGDGKLDLIFIKNTANPALGVFLGNGDGTFTPVPDTPVQAANNLYYSPLSTGDFNGDGYLDVAIPAPQGVLLLLGHGDGTFGSATQYATVNAPTSVVVADFDGDGKLDLALADSSNQSIAVILGNGDGTFRPQQEYPTNGYANSMVVADFNRDGHADIAVANYGPVGGTGAGVAMLLGKGDGSFSPVVTYGAGIEYEFVSVEDINGDGKLDLLIVPPPSTATTELLYLGNGDGTFAITPLAVGNNPDGQPAAALDINSDGAPDILVPSYNSNSVSVLMQSINPIVQVVPSSLAFTVTQGQGNPPPLSLTISNTGGGTETWSATASQNWIVLSQNSGTAPSGIDVTANPSGLNAGTYNGTITVTAAGASNSPQIVPISLTVGAAPVVLSSLAFNPPTLVGPGTSTGAVTLTGSAPNGGASVSLSTDNSAVQVPASMMVPAGQISAQFVANASVVNVQTVATVTATYNGGFTTATLTVNPGVPAVTLSSSTLAYGRQAVGTTTTGQNVTITNTGTAALNLSIAASGDFKQTNNCGGSLQVGGNCQVSVSFFPTTVGAIDGAITLTDNAANSPQLVSLSGAGVTPATLSPASIAFGNVTVDTTSIPKTVTLTNNMKTALNFTFAASGNYAVVGNGNSPCGNSLTAGKSCTLSVSFSPTANGSINGGLTVSDSSALKQQVVALSGTGTGGAAAPLTFNPTSVTFATQAFAAASPPQVVTVKNASASSVTITSIAASGNFAVTGSGALPCNPGTILTANGACTLSATFTPYYTGVLKGAVVVSDNASVSQQVLNVNGTGILPVTFVPTSLTFAPQNVGTTSASKTVTLTNNLSTTLTKVSVGASGDFAIATNNCPSSVPSKTQCTFTITFTPNQTGAVVGAASITDSALTSPQVVNLSGTGQ
jgi:trimeric autotransporter adhesin